MTTKFTLDLQKKTDTRRAVLEPEKAVRALPEKQKVLTFVMTSKGGRRFAERTKEEIINRIDEAGGADVSGMVALRSGFGLAIPIEAPAPAYVVWLFVETKENLCPLCQGAKTVVNEFDAQILPETCWVCNGEGDVATKPLPQRPVQ